MQRNMILLLTISLLSLSGCCSAPVSRVPIPIPEKPTYPTITSVQVATFKQLLPDTYETLGRRDKMCHAYNDRLTGLIEVYNTGKSQ